MRWAGCTPGKVTHRGLTADRILLTDDGQAILLDPGDGDVAASDLQVRLDVAQLLAELSLLSWGRTGPPTLAVEKEGPDELVAVVPLLQPVALARSDPSGAAPPPRRAARAPQAAARGDPGRRGGHPCSWNASGCAPW